MIKTILLIILFVVAFGSSMTFLLAKFFVPNIKSKDMDKKFMAEEKLKKINLISCLVFFCSIAVMLIISKVF